MPHAVADGQGSLFCENGSAGIALLFGVVPELLIAGQIQADLAFLEFGLLEAEEVGSFGIEEFSLCRYLPDDRQLRLYSQRAGL